MIPHSVVGPEEFLQEGKKEESVEILLLEALVDRQ